MGNQTTAVAAEAEKDKTSSVIPHVIFFENRVGAVRIRFGEDFHNRVLCDPNAVNCLHDICHSFYCREVEGYPIHDKDYMDYAVLAICSAVSELHRIPLGCAYKFEPFQDSTEVGPVVYLTLYEKTPTVKSYNCFASSYN